MKATTATLESAEHSPIEPMGDQVNLVVVANPLRPADTKQVTQHTPGQSLRALVGPISDRWAITLNGDVVELEHLDKVKPQAGDWVVMVPQIFGGDSDSGAKQALRIIALIAVSVASMGMATGAFATAGGMFAAGSASALVGAAAISIGGGMLINAVLPPPTPKLDDNLASESTYGVDGPKNTSAESIGVPVLYGESWFGGNIISMYTRNISAERQKLHILTNLGEGPIEGVSEVRINDQPSDYYRNVTIETRLGEKIQAPLPNFSDVVRPVNRNDTMTTDWTLHQATGGCDRVRFDVVFSRGLYAMGKRGKTNHTARLEFQMRPVGETNWIPCFTGNREEYRETYPGEEVPPPPEHTDETPAGMQYPTIVPTNPGRGGYQNYTDSYSVPVGYLGGGPYSIVSVVDKKMTPLRFSFETRNLDATKTYEFRWRNLQDNDDEDIGNTAVVTDVNEILYDDVTYKNTALLSLEIELTDQLSSAPTVIALVKGRRVLQYDEQAREWVEAWSDNPAWITLDALTNRRYGAGYALERIDLVKFREWARYCETNGLKFNGAIVDTSNVIEGTSEVQRAGRAKIVQMGTRFSVAAQMPREPEMMFNSRNIREGSLSLNWSETRNRANELRISYYDTSSFGKEKTVVVRDERALSKGAPLKPSELRLIGVSSQEQAIKEGIFTLNFNRLTLTATFEAPLAAINTQLGDLFYLQHDMPRWGAGGEVVEMLSETQVRLDKEVEMVDGQHYQLLVHRDKVAKWQGQVQQVLGNAVYLDYGFDPQFVGKVTRLATSTGQDYEILDVFRDSGADRSGVVLRDDLTVLPSGHVTLYRTDFTETFDVVNANKSTDTLTLTGAVDQPFSPGTIWSFGVKEYAVKRMTVQSIDGDSEHYRTITALEYDEDIFSPEIIDAPTVVPELPTTNIDVELLGIREVMDYAPGQFATNLEISFSALSKSYAYSELWVIQDGTWEYIGRGRSSTVIKNVTPGDAVRFKLRPITVLGNKPSLDSVREYTYGVRGAEPDGEPTPVNLQVETASNYVELSWGYQGGDANATAFDVYRIDSADGKTAPMDDFTQATRLARVSGANYLDVKVNPSTPYRYWIVGINPYFPEFSSDPLPSGVVQTNDPKSFSEVFPEKIREADLAESVLERFDWPDVARHVTDIEERVYGVTELISRAMTEAQEQADFIANKTYGEFIAVKERHDELVLDVNGKYAEVSETARSAITQNEALAEQLTTFKTQTETSLSTVNQEITSLSGAQSALASEVTSLTSDYNGYKSTVDQSLSTLSTAQSTTSQELTTLRSDYDGNKAAVDQSLTTLSSETSALSQAATSLRSDIDSNKAAADQSISTLSTEQEAISQQLTNLSSEVSGNKASFDQSITTLSTEQESLSTRITNLSSEVAGNKSTVDTQIGTLTTNYNTLSTNVTSLTSEFNGVKNTVGNHTTSISTINQKMGTWSDGTKTISQYLVDLNSDYKGNKAAVNETLSTLSSELETYAGTLSQVSTKANNTATTVSQHAESINGIKGSWGVSVDANGVISGISLMSEVIKGSGVKSELVINSDVFKVAGTGAAAEKTVFATDASTGEAYLRSAIVGEIKSVGYSSTQGFRIDARNGDAYFRSIYARGDIQASSLQANKVMVKTIHIEGRAVTIPTSAYTSSSSSRIETSVVSVQSVTYTSTGAPTEVLASFIYKGSSSGGKGMTCRLYRNGTEIYNSGNVYVPGANESQFCVAIQDTPPSGTVKYELKVNKNQGTDGLYISRRYLRSLETKR